MLKRWLPMPLQSLVLFAAWLLLNNSIAAGHIVLALIFAIAIPRFCTPVQSPQPKAHKPLKIVSYFLVLLWDIIVANLRVARLILGRNRALSPSFIAVPLDMRDELPITILASTISLTPGTLSADVSENREWLYVHALDVDNEAELIAEIKQRYERPLKEIFQC
jgi:multicomponent K+:H+ antiporter subunit E